MRKTFCNLGIGLGVLFAIAGGGMIVAWAAGQSDRVMLSDGLRLLFTGLGFVSLINHRVRKAAVR